MPDVDACYLDDDHEALAWADESAQRVEQDWEQALAGVEPPELRDHLRLHCLEPFWSRAAGACHLGANEWPTGTSALDGRRKLVAGWEFGESQSGVAVVG
ncbi:hypothetical protein ACFYMB_25910 [Micromonospora haikouensis]|uniref:hypothetical protein n=1 Tax=Micromonospora haikouensis TaxID=686309 RepID=UPI00367EA096